MKSPKDIPFVRKYLRAPLRRLGSNPSLFHVASAYHRRVGSDEARILEAQRTGEAPSLGDALALIARRWPNLDGHSDESPVFLLSAGWRSGSTLLQRVLMNDGQTLLWGEPFGHTDLATLANPLRALTTHFPEESYFVDQHWPESASLSTTELSEQWIANLYPTVRDLRRAHVAFFETLFQRPCAARGIERWGVKEVRWDIHFAEYLKWLFPRAKFLFLVRDPYKAYKSYKRWDWLDLWPHRHFYERWPDAPIDSPERFGEHWVRLAAGFREGHDRIGGILVRYEDMVKKEFDWAEMERYLQVAIKADVISQSPMTGQRKTSRDNVRPSELRRLDRVVQPFAKELGYSHPSAR